MAWRWTESKRIAIASLGLAGLIPPIGPSPPAPPGQQPGGGVSVKIASTGDASETRHTVPIARHPGGGSRVAMSMTPSQLPSIQPGDVLAVSAEVEVTTRFT